MDEDIKNRIKGAIARYSERQSPKVGEVKRHNEKPEKELEASALTWLRANHFHVHVVESKATYNPKAGRYISQSIKDGFADIVGNHETGISVFIELKAPGRRSTLRDKQRDFLAEKIATGCFAVCIDCVNTLAAQWEHFKTLHYRRQYQMAKEFLTAALPRPVKHKDEDEPIFHED